MTPPIDDPEAIRSILGTTEALLLDFDGPVCSVFAGFPAPVVADQLRDILPGSGQNIPDDVRDSADPFDVLFYAVKLGPSEGRYVEAAFRAHEVEAVQSAEPTPGAHELIRTWKAANRSLAIVSNNSESAIETYLDFHGLRGGVDLISARRNADLHLLKPNKHLVTSAAQALGASPADCTFVGDSLTDAEAANAARVRFIAYVNKPGKMEGFMSGDLDAITTTVSLLTAFVAGA